ncbi:MAG: hypothetical protein ACREV5_12635 [Steroidobacter sp.]
MGKFWIAEVTILSSDSLMLQAELMGSRADQFESQRALLNFIEAIQQVQQNIAQQFSSGGRPLRLFVRADAFQKRGGQEPIAATHLLGFPFQQELVGEIPAVGL